MADRVRIAVAGAGLFGREHIRTLAGMDDVAIAGIADPGEAGRREVAARYGIELAVADVGELIDRAALDGLVIATPGHTHVPIATLALSRGIPVLVEKPVAMEVAEADILIAAEAASTAFALPGHILRFSAAYREALAIVRSGEIGDILSVSTRRHRDDSHAARYPDIDPVLMTMIHDIDVAVWFTGAGLASVLALRSPPETFRSETLATGSGEKGCTWHLASAWTYPTHDTPPDKLEVVGTEGSVEMEFGRRISVFGMKPRVIDLTAGPPDDELRTELTTFAAGIRAGAHPGGATLAEARQGLAAADAIVRSLATRDVVRL
ncbi:MAG: Gfo/Idh/MocA family oxidoreductase [Rhizobiales bacterium]|nr:Gfo/Idh/MocA family oxidoreductase [Hyphomicrobiales bacterium]